MKSMKRFISSVIMFIVLIGTAYADRLAIPSGSLPWSTLRDTYLNVMTAELYTYLGATEGALPVTPTFEGMIISGSGNSWIQVYNNTEWTDTLTGLGGFGILNWHPYTILNGTPARLALYSELGSFAFDTFPTYEDSAHSSGIAVNGTTLAVYSETASKWLTVALTDTLNATPATYSLALSIVDSGTITINSTPYTSSGSPHTITGLSGATTITAAYGGSNDLLTWTGTDAANVSGTYPNYSITMDAAKSVTATFSVAASYRFVWDCSTLTAGTYDADDGGTVAVTSDGTPSYSFVTGQTGNGIQLASGSRARFLATSGNNVNWATGGIEFYYRYDAGTPSSATHIVSSTYTDPADAFLLRRSSVDNDTYTLVWAANGYTVDTSINVFDGSFHKIKMEWVCSAQTFKLTIDSTEYNVSLSSTTVPNPAATQRIYFNGYSDSVDNQQVTIDEVKIW